uniref:Ribosomal protein S14 n=1 Tax=Citrus maxima TaxID=37334 RepID=K7PHL3_CITMA|nr:ribosomal protein S14 [Citrus maxima]
MARKSLIQREEKRHKLEQKFHLLRRSSKKEINKAPSLSDKWKIHGKLQSAQIMSKPTFLHQRFSPEEQPRTNSPDYGLAGPKSREMVLACPLQGATRSSW